MRFIITGNYRDSARTRSVQWDDGTLSGDPELVGTIKDWAAFHEGQSVGPAEGPYTERDHLADPLSAAVLIAELLDPRTIQIDGDAPVRPSIPAGAIG